MTAHTDHPARHWDRTCPACIADRAGLVIDYMRLRLAIGVLGVLLPFVLVAVAGERESIVSRGGMVVEVFFLSCAVDRGQYLVSRDAVAEVIAWAVAA